MKSKFQDKVQVFSGAMMIPIILIVAAGLSIGLGSAFTNLDNVKLLRLSWLIKEGNIFYMFFHLISSAGFMVMRYLPTFFAIGVSMGLAKREKGWAALAGFVMYLGTNYTLNAVLALQNLNEATTSVEHLVSQGLTTIAAQKENALYGNVLGIFTYNTSIFGALLCAFAASFIHNALWDKELPPALSFFSGVRLVQLTIVAASIPMGIALYFMWPFLGSGIQGLGEIITKSGLFGSFLFGALDRGLLPFGLHHLIAFPIEYTPLSGTMTVDGIDYFGVRNIMTAQLGDPEAVGYITRNFTTGRILFHYAGLPGAAFAMYRCARPENKKKLLSLLVPIVLTVILIGVTEPLEFAFVYTAPLLYYLIHVPLAGLAYVLTEILNVSIYGFAVWNMWPNLLQPQKVHAIALLFLLPLYFAAYYIGFSVLIKKLGLQVPGQETAETTQSQSTREVASNSETTQQGIILGIIEALGGADNIINITNCATRLRVELTSVEKVADKAHWEGKLEARGLIVKGNAIQIIYGTHVQGIARDIKTRLSIE